MKKILLLFMLGTSLQALSQYRTTYSPQGDALTEITDASAMRQGKWTFYDVNNLVIREEIYANNKLVSRSYELNGNTISTLSFDEIKIDVPAEIRGLFHGEMLIDEKGQMRKVSMYSTPQGDREQFDVLKSFLTSIASKNQSRILVF